jgi:hypothetical protein
LAIHLIPGYSGLVPNSAAQLLGRRLAAELTREPALRHDDLGDGLGRVIRDPRRPRGGGHGPGDGLADPPGGVDRERVPLPVIELLHRPAQAHSALLDQVEERHAPVGIPLGDADDEPQMRLKQPVLSLPTQLSGPQKAVPLVRGQRVGVEGEPALRAPPSRDARAQLGYFPGSASGTLRTSAR